jgi:class 3 adenylate cyclase
VSGVNRPVKIRFSIRWKIILPFVLLAGLLGLGAVVLINRQLAQAEQVRYLRQLRDSGQQAVDEVVRLEARLLEIERVLANTEGVPEAVALNDAELLRSLVLQSVVNSDTDLAVFLDREGTSLLAVRRSRPDAAADYLTLRGEDYYTSWASVRQVLHLEGVEGSSIPEKQAGLEQIELSGDDVWAFFVAGPLVDEEGTVFGAVLTGRYLSKVVDELADTAGAHVSIYTGQMGDLLATDFSDLVPAEAADLALEADASLETESNASTEEPYRTIQVAGQSYGEVLMPFSARDGTLEMGVLGVSLLGGEGVDSAYQEYQGQTRRVILYAGISLALVLVVGLLVSTWITRPIAQLTTASQAAVNGNFDTRVPEGGSDEIGALANTFNRFLDGIREGDRYRDMISQTLPDQARDELRKSLSNGDRPLAGREARVALLYVSINGLAGESGRTDPRQTLHDMNQVYPAVVKIINRHGGMLDNISGLGLNASFGLLPHNLPIAVSSLQAVHAGMELLEYIQELNEARAGSGSPPLDIAVGISSGAVIAGGVEALDRVHLAILGDAAEQAATIAQAAGSAPGSSILISGETYEDLGSARSYLTFGRRGELQLPGATRGFEVIEVLSRSTRLVDTSDVHAGIDSDSGQDV